MSFSESDDGRERELSARKTLESCDVAGADELEVAVIDDVVYLHGRLANWDDVVQVGHAVAGQPGLSNLVCKVLSSDSGAVEEEPSTPPSNPLGNIPLKTQVIVVGGGIIGICVARALLRTGFEVLVLESGGSIGGATTSWNNGMIHSGLDPSPESLKAHLNVLGNGLWPALAFELDVPLLSTGSLLVARTNSEVEVLKAYLGRALANGVPGAEILNRERALELESHLNSDVLAVLWTPSAAYIDPVQTTRAMAEDIRENGGNVVLRAPVTGIEVDGARIQGVHTPSTQVEAEIVINAAGLYADEISAMAGCQRYSIHPRRGTLVLFDEEAASPFQRAVGLLPHEYTKGGGMTPRPGGVTVGGPTAVEQQSKCEVSATGEEIEEILAKGRELLPDFPVEAVQEVGAGLRAATFGEDFVVEPAKEVAGFFHVAGLQSPGVASAPAVAELVTRQVTDARFTGFASPNVAGRFRTRAERKGHARK